MSYYCSVLPETMGIVHTVVRVQTRRILMLNFRGCIAYHSSLALASARVDGYRESQEVVLRTQSAIWCYRGDAKRRPRSPGGCY